MLYACMPEMSWNASRSAGMLISVLSSDMLDIAQTVYSRYERGYQTIPLPLLMRLADQYDVSLDYLTGRTSNAQMNR